MQTSNKGRVAELALGTVQLGLNYGINNLSGQPSLRDAQNLVRKAIDSGITHLDCAAAYGDAEVRLGQILDENYRSRVTVVTKLSPLPQLSEHAERDTVNAFVDASVYRSCVNLKMTSLPYLLLHRWVHRHTHDGMLWERLTQLRTTGVIQRLGASIQNPQEALAAISDPDIKFIQLPFNILDRRLQRSGFIEKAKQRDDVIIQARSVLLQGLLLAPVEKWPSIAGIDAKEVVDQLIAYTNRYGRKSMEDLCIAYVRSQPWIDCLVIGMENEQQLEQNIALFHEPKLTQAQCAELENTFANLPEALLNPALWPK